MLSLTASWLGGAAPVGAQVSRFFAREVRAIPPDGPSYSLSRVAAITTLPGSRVAVLSTGERAIRVFDSTGVLTATIGRDGGGPGEFRAPATMGLIGESIWVGDPGLARVSIFTANGSLVRTLAVRVPGLPVLLKDGAMSVLPSRRYSSRRVASEDTIVVARMRDAARVTVARISAPYRTLAVPMNGGTRLGPQPFDDEPLLVAASTGAGFVVVDRSLPPEYRDAHFRVTSLSHRGDTVFSKRIPYIPQPVTPAHVSAAVGRFGNDGPTRTRQFVDATRRALYVPKWLPPVTRVVVARTGEIWLRREEAAGPVQRYTVLSPTGTVNREVAVPASYYLLEASGDKLWGVRIDDGLTTPVCLVLSPTP